MKPPPHRHHPPAGQGSDEQLPGMALDGGNRKPRDLAVGDPRLHRHLVREPPEPRARMIATSGTTFVRARTARTASSIIRPAGRPVRAARRAGAPAAREIPPHTPETGARRRRSAAGPRPARPAPLRPRAAPRPPPHAR